MEENRTEETGLMTPEQRQKEIREAIQAGEAALSSLNKSYEYLGSAGGWGIFDMIAGGLFSSMIKHSKLDNAKSQMEDAKEKLDAFQKELKDVSQFPDFEINVDGFLKFADIWLDNFFVDWAVQSKISQAEKDVYTAVLKVREILDGLRQMLV